MDELAKRSVTPPRAPGSTSKRTVATRPSPTTLTLFPETIRVILFGPVILAAADFAAANAAGPVSMPLYASWALSKVRSKPNIDTCAPSKDVRVIVIPTLLLPGFAVLFPTKISALGVCASTPCPAKPSSNDPATKAVANVFLSGTVYFASL